jgi:polar amino acid transport system substrate-binding protein
MNYYSSPVPGLIPTLRKPGIFCLVIIMVIMGIILPAHGAESPLESGQRSNLTLNTAQTPPRTRPDGSGFQDIIIRKALGRLGIPVQIEHLPSERAMINANEGIDDGVLVRVAGLEEIYPNLIRVPEQVTTFEFSAFTKTINPPLRNWEDLKPYHVGIICGWKILEIKLTGVQSLTRVKDEVALFSLLAGDRVDFIVYDRMQGLALMEAQHLQNIRILEPPLAVKPMYLYLNKKHQDLVPQVGEALREMRVSGLIDRITAESTKNRRPFAEN